MRKNTKTWIIGGCAALLVIGGIGAAVGSETETTSVPAIATPHTPAFVRTTAPAETTIPTDVKDAVFLDAIKDSYPNGGQEHIDVAIAACKAFDDGVSLEAVILAGLAEGLEGEELGTLLGAGIFVYCPQHADLIPEA